MIVISFLLLPAMSLARERPSVIIHRRGEANCHTFRIPAIARTVKGTLLAVYDMRYNSRNDLQGHMDIGLSRSTDGGKTWEKPRPIMDMGEFGGLPQNQNGCSDPNILVDRKTGEIIVSALWTHGKPGTHQWRGNGSEPGHDITKSTQFMVVRSIDDGITWAKHSSDHGALPEPVCMASLISHTLRDGRRILFFSNPNSKTKRENMTIRASLDDGKTWPANMQILLDKKGGAYSSLVIIDDNTLGILYESSIADLVFQKVRLSELGL